MLDILKEYGFTLLQLMLEAVLPVLAVFIIQWVRAQIQIAMDKLNDNQRAILNEAARIAVLAAEQMNLAGKVADKKAFAVDFAQKYLDEHGIIISLGTIEGAIEAAVMSEFNQQPELLTSTLEVTEG